MPSAAPRITFERAGAMVSAAAGTVAVFWGSAVLAGWHYRLESLKSLPGGIAMAPNTALCLMLLGTGLLLLRPEAGPVRRVAGKLLAAAVLLFGLLTLAEHLVELDSGASQVFFHHRLADWTGTQPPGRFAPSTALGLLLISSSLLALDLRRHKRLAENLALLALLVALVVLTGYAYGIGPLLALEPYARTSPNGALLLFVVAVGALFARPDKGVAGLLASRDPAGIMTRRLLAMCFVVLFAMGWVEIRAQRAQLVNPDFATSILVVLCFVMLSLLIVGTARVVRRFERERRRAEETLRTTEKLAVTGRLAAALAHEVNNPLASVTNLLYLLGQHPGLDERAQEYIRMAEEELQRVTHVAKQTLAFYREASSRVPVRLDEVAASVVDLYRPALAKTGVTVRERYQEVPEIEGYPGEMRQVISNLLGNAIDAVAADGIVEVRVRAARDWRHPQRRGVRVLVADNGCGISSLNLGRLFEPFFTTKGQKGTGLGLWVTHGLVVKQGGSIKVRSSVRPRWRGTAFSVFFPYTTEPARKAVPAAADPAKPLGLSAARSA